MGRLVLPALIISLFLIFNQTTTEQADMINVRKISLFLIFNQTTTAVLELAGGAIISLFLIFNQTTTPKRFYEFFK